MNNTKLVTNDLKGLRQLVKSGANQRDSSNVKKVEYAILFALEAELIKIKKPDADFTRDQVDKLVNESDSVYAKHASRELIDAALENMVKNKTVSLFGVNPVRYKLNPEFLKQLSANHHASLLASDESILKDFEPTAGMTEEDTTLMSNIKGEITFVFTTRGSTGLSVTEMDNLINRELFPDLTIEDLHSAMDYMVTSGVLTTQRIRNETVYNPSKRLLQSVEDNRVRARKFEVERQYEHSPLGIISKTDTLEQAIWKTMSDYKPRTISDVGLILQTFGFSSTDVKKYLYKPSNRVPNRYIVEMIHGKHTIKLSKDYPYPVALPSQPPAKLETIVETQPLAQSTTESQVTETPPSTKPQFDPNDSILINAWKIMSDYQWYKVTEVHELLQAISTDYTNFSPRSSKLKEDGWFDVMPADKARPGEKHGKNAQCLRLKKDSLCPIKFADKVIWRQAEIAEYVHRTPGLPLEDPVLPEEPTIKVKQGVAVMNQGVEEELADVNKRNLIFVDIWKYLSAKTAVVSREELRAHLEESYSSHWVATAMMLITADTWLIIKPNVKYKDNPFYTLKKSVYSPILKDDGTVVWKQDEVKRLCGELQEKAIAEHQAKNAFTSKTTTSSIPNPPVKTNMPYVKNTNVPAVANRDYVDATQTPPLLVAKFTIELKGIDLTLEEAKRIVGFYEKHPERLVIGTGDGLIGDDTVKIKGVPLNQGELNEVVDKLTKFVMFF